MEIKYGRNLFPDILALAKNWLVITTPPILNFVRAQAHHHDVSIHFAPSMDEVALKDWEQKLPPSNAILGIGGGVCMDAAKYVAWKRDLILWQLPSIISADACVTETIGIRRNGRVKYIGKIYPQAIVVDFALIQHAPKHLNRAGAGDILSIHTALWDWKLAATKIGERFDPQIAEKSAQLLNRLEEAAEEIYNVTEVGIKTLVELYVAEVQLCQQMGNSRPEEGSEHFWAYHVEYLTHRGYIHGELVALGVLLMSILQENNIDFIRALIKRLGIRWLPKQIGIRREEMIQALMTTQDYVSSDSLPFSVLNTRPVSEKLAIEIFDQALK